MQTLSKTFRIKSCSAFNKYMSLSDEISYWEIVYKKIWEIIGLRCLKNSAFYYLRVNNSFLQVKFN